jgi:hypothetical protein
LLAGLLLRANRLVSTAELIGWMWGSAEPDRLDLIRFDDQLDRDRRAGEHAAEAGWHDWFTIPDGHTDRRPGKGHGARDVYANGAPAPAPRALLGGVGRW